MDAGKRNVFLLPLCWLALASCLPVNSLPITKSTTAVSNSVPSNTITIGLGPGATDDGAQGQCLAIDNTNPERQICKDCYTSVLNSRCPGKADPSACLDPDVRNGFTNLVNQCISQSIQAGFICPTTCTGLQVVDPRTCTCVNPPPTSQVGAGGTAFIDNGLTDFGPPVVSAFWANSIGTTTPANNGSSCDAQVDPILLYVRNRGDTVKELNQYTVQSAGCIDSNGAALFRPSTGSYLPQGVAAPAAGANGDLKTNLHIQTDGFGEPSRGYFQDFELGVGFNSHGEWSAGVPNLFVSNPNDNPVSPAFVLVDGVLQDPRITNPAFPAGNVTAPSGVDHPASAVVFTQFLGRYSGTANTPAGATLTLTSLAPGKYRVTFLLYLFDNWRGNSGGPDIFQVLDQSAHTGNSGPTPFSESFTNNVGQIQTYTGPAIFTGGNLGFTTASGDSVTNDSIYKISFEVDHPNQEDLKLRFQDNGKLQGISTPVWNTGSIPAFWKNDNVANQSWGLDRVQITPLTGGLPHCGVKYQFTDSNQLTSTFCMRFVIHTECLESSCTCNASPDISTGDSYFSGQAPQANCP